ncbi:MAG TPA: outer membrane lipoprotein-sorting protein [Bacteroidales bacterium]|nr:outer membrane lipoprotein-sorting protein [Bacteroidales bacterium]
MMKKITMVAFLLLALTLNAQDAKTILAKVDQNMASKNRVFESTMTVHGKRASRTMTSKSYSVGENKSFTEYLSPVREQGTKMLKVGNQLWIYSPSTDRTILISGQMLRQSVMGSDLSYEDMMEDSKLTDKYQAVNTGTEVIDGRKCYVLELTAMTTDVNYFKRKSWIDTERFVPLKEELFAKSGQLLKRTILSGVKQVQGRWFPTVILYKDMLKAGEGTEFKMTSILFDQVIPDYIFSKAALKQ